MKITDIKFKISSTKIAEIINDSKEVYTLEELTKQFGVTKDIIYNATRILSKTKIGKIIYIGSKKNIDKLNQMYYNEIKKLKGGMNVSSKKTI